MKFYNLHTHQLNPPQNVTALVNQYPWDFQTNVTHYSIGIHPWYIDTNRLETDLQIMENHLQAPQCLAVGECGLDKRIAIPMSTQIEVFRAQIALAETYQKPIVVHLVAAFDELIALKKELHIQVPLLLHGFSKNTQVAQQLLQQGCYLSFGKYLLRQPELASVLASVPNDQFFLETDTMEESIETVYQRAADIKNLSLLELQQLVAHNWERIFGKSEQTLAQTYFP